MAQKPEHKIFLILSITCFCIQSTNLIEQPYARSLVVCDTPVNTTAGAEFSGSAHCGDRLYVIDEGAAINGRGQSFEKAGRFVVTVFICSFAEYGRKRAMVFGQTMILMSTLLFCVTGLTGRYAIPCYSIAQILQGIGFTGAVQAIVMGDVALRSSDSVGVYKEKAFLTAFTYAVLGPGLLHVMKSEYTDFTVVWMCVSALSVFALQLLAWSLEETLPEKKEEEDTRKLSLLQMSAGQIRGYWELFTASWYPPVRLLEKFLGGIGDPSPAWLPFLMAQFGFTQMQAMGATIPPLVLAAILAPMAQDFCHKYGYRSVYKTAYFWFKAMYCLAPCVVLHSLRVGEGRIPGLSFQLVCVAFISGWAMTIVPAVDIRLVGAANNAKFQTMMQMATFASESIGSFLYPDILFDAEAVTVVGKLAPFLTSSLIHLGTIPLWLWVLGPQQLAQCDMLTLNGTAVEDIGLKVQLVAAQKKPEGDAKKKLVEVKLIEAQRKPEGDASKKLVEVQLVGGDAKKTN